MKIVVGLCCSLLLILFAYSPVIAENSWNISRISSDTPHAGYPQLVSGNNEWGTVWIDDRESDLELYFALINYAGKRIGNEIKLTDNSVDDLTPALVWNGEDYGVFWSYDRSQIFFTRINGQGKKILNDVSIEVSSRGYAIHVSAVWNGEEYGVVWWDVRDAPACIPQGTRGRAFFARVNNSGQMIGSEIPVSDAFSNPWQDYKPLIVWDGENYAVFWNDGRANGQKILGDIKLESNELSPQLTDVEADEDGYIIAYNGRIATGHLAKMDFNGRTIWVDIPINPSGRGGSPTISIHDATYFLAWGDFRDRTPQTFYNTEIYYTITDRNANKIIPETRITFEDEPSGEQTQISFLRNRMGLAWVDHRDGSP